MITFADRLREEIAYSGLTRKELAHHANIKQRALDMYVGKQASMPPADVAVRLAKTLNVTVEYLVSGEKTAHEQQHLLQHQQKLGEELETLSAPTKKFIETTIHLFSEYEKKQVLSASKEIAIETV